MIHGPQLLLLLIEAAAVASLFLVAFRVRHTLGLSLVTVALGVLQPIQVQLSASLYAQPIQGLFISPGSAVLFPCTLMVVLLVYIREDALAVRQVVYGLVASNLIVTALYLLFGLHLQLEHTANLLDLPVALFIGSARVMFAGTLSLIADVLLIIVVYERLGGLRSFPALRCITALALILTLDTVLFSILAFAGTESLLPILQAGLVGKLVASIVYGLTLTAYLRWGEPGTAEHTELADVFQALTYRERYTLARAAARQAAAAAEARRQILLEASTDGLLVLAAHGAVVETNGRALHILDGTKADLTGSPLRRFLPHVQLPDLIGAGTLETRAETLHGNRFPVDVSVVRAEDSGEIILSIRDVSARVALQNEQLQAGKMETVGLLASGVTHDFNNLLTIIFGALDLLRMQGKLTHPVKLIEGAAHKAADLTAKLLSFARLQVVDDRVLQPNDQIASLRGLLDRVLDEDVTLGVSLASTHPVRISPSSLDQVLLNLVANARDALPDGGNVEIATRDVDDAQLGPAVVIEVQDDGIGMTEELLDRVFEPYFTTKLMGRGTGLGLATCAGIVEQSGGRLEVTSTPGIGTVFRVILQGLPGHTVDPTPQPSMLRARSSGTVLVVEDDEDVRAVTSQLLEARGYDVRQAPDIDEALLLLQCDSIDVMLTDVMLPSGSGRALAAKVRRSHPSLPILIMTGHDLGEIEPQFPVLRKPFPAAMLFDALDEAMADTDASRAP